MLRRTSLAPTKKLPGFSTTPASGRSTASSAADRIKLIGHPVPSAGLRVDVQPLVAKHVMVPVVCRPDPRVARRLLASEVAAEILLSGVHRRLLSCEPRLLVLHALRPRLDCGEPAAGDGGDECGREDTTKSQRHMGRHFAKPPKWPPRRPSLSGIRQMSGSICPPQAASFRNRSRSVR